MKDWGFVAAIALARVAFGFQFQTIASMGPELAARFHLEFAALGTLIGLYMLPGIVVSHARRHARPAVRAALAGGRRPRADVLRQLARGGCCSVRPELASAASSPAPGRSRWW